MVFVVIQIRVVVEVIECRLAENCEGHNGHPCGSRCKAGRVESPSRRVPCWFTNF